VKDTQLLEYLQSYLTDNRKVKFEKIVAQRTRHLTVVLEDIYQKHNTSAVVRNCDIFGIQDLHIIENKYNSYVSNQVAKGAQNGLIFTNIISMNIIQKDVSMPYVIKGIK
jgi:tRNA (guanosine-2'-O-)-methyltransferase